MVKEYIVEILVKRISNNGINPVKNEIMTVEDIKNAEYKQEVISRLNVS